MSNQCAVRNGCPTLKVPCIMSSAHSKKRTRKIHKRNFTEVESSRNGSASGSLARGLCLYLGFNRRLRTKICHARTARHWSSDVAIPNDFAKGRSGLKIYLWQKKKRVGGSPPLIANGLVKAAAATAHSSSTLQRSEAKPRKHREYLSRS